jgi:phosphatidylserine decarboxylase
MQQVRCKQMITRYGYDVYFTVLTICFVAVVLSLTSIAPGYLRYLIAAISILFIGFATNFFRDPERTTPEGDRIIVAPADGKIVVVKQVNVTEFMESGAWQISIFMSPLDVHVNRIPAGGIVKYTRYVKGEYFAAFEDKASEKNEQMIIGIDNSNGKIMFKQIAGFIARRIVCELKSGDTVHTGEKFGMIKFGSRVDIFIPANAEIKVKMGDRTTAGETILGEFK